MPQIELQNVPDPLYRALAERAAKNHRSLEQEAIDCLDTGVRVAERDAESVERTIQDMRAFRSSLGSLFVTEEELQQAKREGRP